MPNQDVWSKEIAREVVAKWRESGLSMSDYARNNGFKVHRLSYWNQRFPLPTVRAEKAVVENQPTLLEVRLKPEPSVPIKSNDYAPMELLLVNGMRLKIPSRFDSVSLEQLLWVLERRSC